MRRRGEKKLKAQVKIFDTTLRDGEQSPGATMNVAEKVRIAQQLEKLGVDIIEAGFPISSPGDFDAVKTISKTIIHSEVAALARANPQDIDRAWEAVKAAKIPPASYLYFHLRHPSQTSAEKIKRGSGSHCLPGRGQGKKAYSKYRIFSHGCHPK